MTGSTLQCSTCFTMNFTFSYNFSVCSTGLWNPFTYFPLAGNIPNLENNIFFQRYNINLICITSFQICFLRTETFLCFGVYNIYISIRCTEGVISGLIRDESANCLVSRCSIQFFFCTKLHLRNSIPVSSLKFYINLAIAHAYRYTADFFIYPCISAILFKTHTLRICLSESNRFIITICIRCSDFHSFEGNPCSVTRQ